jgi:hypothetical protein
VEQQKLTMEQVLINRLAGEVGTLRTQAIQLQLMNEALEARIKELEGEKSE